MLAIYFLFHFKIDKCTVFNFRSLEALLLEFFSVRRDIILLLRLIINVTILKQVCKTFMQDL